MSASKSTYDYSAKGIVSGGLTGFAGVMFIAVGAVEVLQAIAALGSDDIFVEGQQYSFQFDVTAWGWVHLVLGLLGIGIGAAILTRRTVGLLAGIALAFVNTIAEFAFLPYYPFWSIVVIAFNVLIIWALCSQISHDNAR